MDAVPPAVVLVRPREEGNVGSAARAMANMGLDRLILVEPAPLLGKVAAAFGVVNMPSTFLVAADGTIVDAHPGAVTEASLRKLIAAKLLP